MNNANQDRCIQMQIIFPNEKILSFFFFNF